MRKGDAMAEKIKLRDGQELPIFPLGEGRLEALLLIKAFAKKICFRGDGDFADGRRMLETREEEIKESFGVQDGES